jgi:hypothetical protein
MSLRRTGCLGACPDYTLTLWPDGRVEFEGRAFVTTVGPASGRIAEADARHLIDRLEAIDFFHLEDCVGNLDAPQLALAADTKRGLHRVTATAGCVGRGVAEVERFAREFETAAQSQRWVGRAVPCDFAIGDRIYFTHAGSTDLSESARLVLAPIAVALRKFPLAVTLVAARRAGEPPERAIARAGAVKDALVAAGIPAIRVSVEAGDAIDTGPSSVSFRLDMPRCEPGRAWVAVPSGP